MSIANSRISRPASNVWISIAPSLPIRSSKFKTIVWTQRRRKSCSLRSNRYHLSRSEAWPSLCSLFEAKLVFLQRNGRSIGCLDSEHGSNRTNLHYNSSWRPHRLIDASLSLREPTTAWSLSVSRRIRSFPTRESTGLMLLPFTSTSLPSHIFVCLKHDSRCMPGFLYIFWKLFD